MPDWPAAAAGAAPGVAAKPHQRDQTQGSVAKSPRYKAIRTNERPAGAPREPHASGWAAGTTSRSNFWERGKHADTQTKSAVGHLCADARARLHDVGLRPAGSWHTGLPDRPAERHRQGSFQ